MDSVALNQAIQSLSLLLDAESVLSRIGYHTESIRQTGQNLRAYCPIHKETLIRSLNVDTLQRSFRCGYSRCPGARGGNLFDLYVLASGKSREDALREWQGELGLSPGGIPIAAAGRPEPAASAPAKTETAPKPEVSPKKEAPPPSPAPAAVSVSAPAEEVKKPAVKASPPPLAPPAPELIPAMADVPADLQDAILDLDAAPGETQQAPDAVLSEPQSRGPSPLLRDITEAIDKLDEIEPLDEIPALTTRKEASPESPARLGQGFASLLSQVEELMEGGDMDAALERTRDAMRVAESGEEKARVRLCAGRCQFKTHRYTQAQREFNAGLDNSGLHRETEQELRYNLGLSLEARKDLRSALATLKGLVAEYGSYRDAGQIIQRVERAIQNTPARGGDRISFV